MADARHPNRRAQGIDLAAAKRHLQVRGDLRAGFGSSFDNRFDRGIFE